MSFVPRVHFMAGLIMIVWNLCVAGVPVASAQSAADLFDAHILQEVRLFINERDLTELRQRYREHVYFPADVEWRGLRVQNVGIRSRGLASRSATKPGLRIDFNRYTPGQRFLGLSSLLLDNLTTDPSMVRERVAMAFFERLGQPASRESFARVYINNVFQGLYAVVEAVDADFLARTLGERMGYLFERHFLGEYRGEDLGDDPTAYRSVFQPVNHELESDAVLYTPIRDLFHEVNQPVDAVWRERVERYVDLAQLVTHAAIETSLSEADGMLGGSGMTNFYLYRRLDADRHRVIVWDKDRTFAAIDSPILQGAAANILVSRALAFADLRSLYLDTLDRSARLAMANSWLEREISRATSLVGAAAHDDPVKPYANDVFEAAGEFLMQFARRRPAFVIEAVEHERSAR